MLPIIDSSVVITTIASTSGNTDNVDTGSPSAQEVTPEPGTTPTATVGAGRGFRAWLNGDGARFRHGIKGKTNWIGDTPFPLNPSFRPLPPLADSIKSRIFNAYTYNIVTKDATDSQVVRAISHKFGVAMDRVRAIIRLKELEQTWKQQGKSLQTELLRGMESHLGVKTPGDNWRGVENPEAGKPLYAPKKTMFEMVDVEGGDSPVFLPLLASLPPRPADKPVSAATSTTTTNEARTTIVAASRPGRPAFSFKDVSGTLKGQEWANTYNPNKTKRGKKPMSRTGTTQ
ncbi:hypothetical protein OIO90_000649 [Microbotryomycetes sp. JL221]|nr:hypothetical protein OIO90_000649 [Microbotryomycetes sp. JL221]